jgi:soluble lytic murein transglycosylase-like protein
MFRFFTLFARALSAGARLLPAALILLAAVCGGARCAPAQDAWDNAPLRARAAWREGLARLEQYRRGNGPPPPPMSIGPARAVPPSSRPPAGAGPDWQRIIRGAGRRHGVDEALLTAVIRVESNFNPNAVSRRGALGAMQIMPETGRALGLENFFDPEANVDAGARYLAGMLRMFPSLELSLAAYNAGPGEVRRRGGSVPPYGETRAYVERVLSEYRRLTLHREK